MYNTNIINTKISCVSTFTLYRYKHFTFCKVLYFFRNIIFKTTILTSKIFTNR